MIEKIKYNEEDGSIDIDNSELLKGRADIAINHGQESDTFKGAKNGLGGIEGEEENKLKKDERGRWHEPTAKKMDVLHVCPVCNTKFKGRTNCVYCTTKCKELAKKRRQRKRAKEIKNFKPYRGKTGEVYFITKTDDVKTISFIPAINAETRIKAQEYISDNFSQLDNSPNEIENYITQVNTVIQK